MGWVALLLAADAAREPAGGPLAPFTAAGQGVSAAVAVFATGLLFLLRTVSTARPSVVPRGVSR
ncbi:hypothetical protein SFUMM280S_05304 [Streptomyces fumanus]